MGRNERRHVCGEGRQSVAPGRALDGTGNCRQVVKKTGYAGFRRVQVSKDRQQGAGEWRGRISAGAAHRVDAGLDAARNQCLKYGFGLALTMGLLLPGSLAQVGSTPGGVTSGTTPGQAGLSPSAPAAVPQAAKAVPPGEANGGGNAATAKPEPTLSPLSANLMEFAGQTVKEIRYEGVDFDKTDRLQSELKQKSGTPFNVEEVRDTTRRLFATGRYRTIAVRVLKEDGGVVLVFAGVPRFYVGRVQINGLSEDRLASLLEYGTQLDPGAPFTNASVTAATEAVKQVLAQNGYYEPKISVVTVRDDANQQVDVTYTVAEGPQAKVGVVTIDGKDPGITVAEVKKRGKLQTRILKHPVKVDRETASTALGNLRTFFQKKDRLEATATLEKSTYDADKKELDYTFGINQGPVVKVDVVGTKFSKSRLKLLVPVYEEGTVDIDLLNEGAFNMKDYLQQEGYFDASVSVKTLGEGTQAETVQYTVVEGQKHKVTAVNLEGNKYFSTALLQQGLKVQKGDLYMPSGRFSAQLVTADQNSMQAIYRANGFKDATVTSSVKDQGDVAGGKKGKVAQIAVTYKIVEGEQQDFGSVAMKGLTAEQEAALSPLLQAREGQPFSLVTLSGDRDVILSYLLSNGFDQARVEVAQTVDATDKTRTDIGFDVTAGPEVFIGKVLGSGVVHTKPKVVEQQVRVHAGDPLDQSALLETQRNLYNLALFNEVVAAVQNPAGDAEQKNVLLQITEAKRWDVTYGFGFEAQLGTPSCGQYCTRVGTTNAQEGKAGVSPRVLLDVSRINVFGTDDSLTLHSEYGLLETVATLTFQNPHLFGNKNFSGQVSGGYSNVQDISTFQSSKLQGDFRVTQHASKKDTFVYDFQYRRISVNPNSLAIAANLIPLLSEPVRVGGPGITWIRDTRSPSQLDAVKGYYFSIDEFLASGIFGSQTSFNRTDATFSTYYQFGKGQAKYVLARNTRFGFINSYGVNPNAGVSTCAGVLLNTNASCNPVPLPERLYAGGATSHRGFPINGAGPRDLQTGFPVGGSGVLVNTVELRLPPPTLPKVGNSISFVVFDDWGNVFDHVGDVFSSIKRFSQPDRDSCRMVYNVAIGTCNFNYWSNAIGIGLRYKTPVGPIRVDLPYNLNPPIYPVIPTINPNGTRVDNQLPYVGQGSHFGFFFSIGQSF